MGTLSVTGSVWLPTGLRLAASGTTTVNPPMSMLVGSDYKPPTLTRYPRLTYARMFNSGKLASTTGVPTQVKVHLSMESNNAPIDPAVIKAYLDQFGARGGLITIDHEVNGGKKAGPALFKANNQVVAGVLAAHQYGHLWGLVEIYELWAQNHKTPGWDAYTLTLDPATAGLIYAVGWDCYVEQQLTALPDVAAFFAPVLAAVKAAGKPWMVPELGYLPAADPTGTKGGPWLTSCVSYLRTHGCTAVAEWDNPSGNVGYVLTGAALAAWQQAVATQ